MSTGRRASDWLSDGSASRPGAAPGDRRRVERRQGDRRAPRRALDTLFAATLIRHVLGPELLPPARYTPPAPPPGILHDVTI